jgi:hypothetical protein
MLNFYDPKTLMLTSVALGDETIHIQNLIAKRFNNEPYDYYELFLALGDLYVYWVMVCKCLGHEPEDVFAATHDRLLAIKEQQTQTQESENNNNVS